MKYAIRFLCVGATFLAIEQTSFFITKQIATNEWAKKEKTESGMALPPKSESIVRVTAQMMIRIEKYDEQTKEVFEKIPYWDSRIIGMDKESLQRFLMDPANLEEENDRENGYYKSELVSMDWNELCIRKYYLHR